MWLLKAPRWLLITEALLLLGALAIVAYKAAMWVRPLGKVDQAQFLKKADPAVRVREYYEQYPESYLRISKESWQYRQGHAYHSFTLTNGANVAYVQVQIELSYLGRGGTALLKRTVTLPKPVPPLGSLPVSGLEVRNVPAASEAVALRVVSAQPTKATTEK